MAEYIEREAVLKIIYDIKENKEIPKNYGTVLDIIRLIRNHPTADVVPKSKYDVAINTLRAHGINIEEKEYG